jgi:hypothetical protein
MDNQGDLYYMTASSATGIGLGASEKLTTNQLAILANGPSIIFAGFAEADTGVSSPPSEIGSVTFPYPLTDANKYVVLVTTINGGYAYVAARDIDDDGTFHGFTVIAEAECTYMYLVARVGAKPRV